MNALKSNDQIVKQQHFTLLELLDRLLDKGVMVKGEILLTVADIDLVYLNLGLLLSSVKSVEKAYRRDANDDNSRNGFGSFGSIGGVAGENNGADGPDDPHNADDPNDPDDAMSMAWPPSVQEELVVTSEETKLDKIRSDSTDGLELDEPQITIRGEQEAAVSFSPEDSVDEDTGLSAKPLSAAFGSELDQLFRPKANIDPENVEKGLARLVLTLVELLRRLMEKQAIRRIDDKQLNDEEVERMGNAFFLLDKKMEQLKAVFDLKDGDLNLDLGPLGDLI